MFRTDLAGYGGVVDQGVDAEGLVRIVFEKESRSV